MVFRYNISFYILFFYFSAYGAWPGYVFNTSVPLTRASWWVCITSPDSFYISCKETGRTKRVQTPFIMLSEKDGTISFNGHCIEQQSLWFDSKKQMICLECVACYGTVHVTRDNDYMHVAVLGDATLNQKKILHNYFDRVWHSSYRMQRWDSVAQNVCTLIDQAVAQTKKNTQVEKQSRMIRVLLLDKSVHDHTKERLFSAAGFIIYDTAEPQKKYYINNSELDIQYKKNYFVVNGRAYRFSELIVASQQGYITYDMRTYQGIFACKVVKDRFLYVNGIDLESYVCSVVHTESWPGWPLEVNKVFAIMARSYALSQAETAKRCKRYYHIKNTNAHQTYQGVHTNQIVQQAANQTKGMILIHDNKPIIAMFDSCCGGVIPKHIHEYVDFQKAPYLERSYACTYCKKCKIYSWQTEYDLGMFERHVSSELYVLKKLRDIKVSKRDKAGIVLEIILKDSKNIQKISGRQLYSLLHDVKSFCFDVKRKGKKVLIKGKGYGHHCGLCQWGAREMVRRDFDYKQILEFYYPGTTLVRMV